ncbi:Na+/melibiose symporter-like transporter [Treponema rectale]|uniref:Na+/melibiose symporter-like transporter n=2 Tax=Treponema rectale TaxID=744512 RepID=A0A840S8I5_9SPIR|nr:MFS transporter [Treponema rectale]MBB5218949.1 Na+/melibiose symporter-like transporter [Treponema rectale]
MLSGKEKISYGLGAVGKDMVYMLSASYILYYYQDLLGVSAIAMGIILLIARIFDAFNDPIMGIIVAKTKTRWGKFRPWLLIGTLTNAVVLFLMFSAPPALNKTGLIAYAAVTYIVWGVTYTMMDIPYWSMIPAFTKGGKEREGLSALARSCAGVGSAVISIITVMSVFALGMKFSPDAEAYKNSVALIEQTKAAQEKLIENICAQTAVTADELELYAVKIKENKGDEASLSFIKADEKDFLEKGMSQALLDEYKAVVTNVAVAEKDSVKAKVPVERTGYKYFSLIVAVLFVVFIVITCAAIKEKSTVKFQSPSVGEMFRALFRNDQAVVIVAAIVMINTALYITSNLVIYFFKYDFNPAAFESNYSMFNMFGGGFQILAMMILFPLFRKFMNTVKIFYASFFMAFTGYIILLFVAVSGTSNFWALVPSAFLIMSAIGMLNVVVTIFLANTVDYGELKNHRRDESVIFSMQTFVVKLASGISALIASVVLAVCNINKDAINGTKLAASSTIGLRMSMTLIPLVVLIAGLIIFKTRFILNDKKVQEINEQLAARGKKLEAVSSDAE